MLYRATSQWSVFGQYATGFCAPDAAQINGYYENAAEQVTIIPNPDLKPEKPGPGAGARGRFDRLKLDAAIFANQYSNLIMDTVLIRGTGTAADPAFSRPSIPSGPHHRHRGQRDLRLGPYRWRARQHPFSWGRAKGVNRATGAPLNSIDPNRSAWGAIRHRRLGPA